MSESNTLIRTFVCTKVICTKVETVRHKIWNWARSNSGLALSLSLFHSLSLSLTLSLSHSLSYSLTLAHSLTLSLSHSIFYSLTLSLSHSLPLSLSHSLTLSVTLSLFHVLTLSLSHSFTLSLSHSLMERWETSQAPWKRFRSGIPDNVFRAVGIDVESRSMGKGVGPETTGATRSSTTLSSKVNLHHAINFRSLCSTNRNTPKPGPNEPSVLHRAVRRSATNATGVSFFSSSSLLSSLELSDTQSL